MCVCVSRRYTSAGRALLLLTPREAEGMRGALSEAKIPVKTIKINPAKQQPIGPALQALLSKNTQLKVMTCVCVCVTTRTARCARDSKESEGSQRKLACVCLCVCVYVCSQEWCQRALVAYVRSVFLAPDKRVFDAPALPLEAIAASWGLLAAPRMRFLRKVRQCDLACYNLLTHTHTHRRTQRARNCGSAIRWKFGLCRSVCVRARMCELTCVCARARVCVCLTGGQ